MPTEFSKRHSTNEELVAYLDGELDSPRRQSIDEHLATCWHCRARLSALQSRMDEVARASKEFQLNQTAEIGRAPMPAWIAAPSEAAPARHFSFMWLAPALAAGLAIAFFALRPSASAPPQAPRANDILPTRAAIAASEDIRARALTSHQRFAVELSSQDRLARQRLEVWSDASRSALRLRRENGSFVHARWQQNGKTIADRGAPSRSIQTPSQCRSWSDIEALAVGLLRAQPAGRLRLAGGLFRELERRGFHLDATPTQRSGIWRLEASSREDRAWLEIDAKSLRPYLFTMASRDDKISWRIALRLESEAQVEATAVPTDAFIPDTEERTGLSSVKPPPAEVQPITADLELRILAFAARWRNPGESVRAADHPSFAVEATVGDGARRAELERLFETWPLLSFRIESRPQDATGPWCRETLGAAGEAAQHSWFLSRIESPRYASLEPGAGKLRESIASESQAGFAAALSQLDRALRPIRGSAPSALAVFRNKDEALSRLQNLLAAACSAHPDDTLSKLNTPERGDILALLAAAQQFQWALPSAIPTPTTRNEP